MFMYYVLLFNTRHPLTLSALIQARGSQDICFITDSVHQATCPGEFINYNNRKCEYQPIVIDLPISFSSGCFR